MIRYSTDSDIGSQARLVQLLRHIEAQALAEGLRYEVAVQKVRREAAEWNRRELAAMEREGDNGDS